MRPFIFAIILQRIEQSSSNVGWAKRSVPNKAVPPRVGHVTIVPLPNLQT
jgi:hypothetical protein